MNFKKLIIIALLLCITAKVDAQEAADTAAYGVEKAMPAFYRQLKEQLIYPEAWGNSATQDFNLWRSKARKILIECMQNIPPAPKNYDMQVLAVEKRKGYEVRKITFNLSEWYRVKAYLLVPDGKCPFPAIIMLHDHGAHFTIGKEKMVKPFGVPAEIMADSEKWAVQCYDGQHVGDYFAANGYVVLAVDALLWGERGRKEGADYNAQQALAANFMQMGTSWGSIITMDDVRSAEFLASLPEVNPAKTGCLGFSMGAYRSWMLAAITDAVQVSASVCWMNTTEWLMTLLNNQNKGGSAYSMIIPDIRRYMDYPHVASIACPKPSLFFNGEHDKLFPVQGVRDAYAIMQNVWNSRQAGDRLIQKIWDEKHFFSKQMQTETLDFFNKFLKTEK